ncbi:MAG TPA: hypothetical protein VGG72_20940 [Bryobacteraceae bacterium]|jgi:hypothetical protein
MTPEQNPQSIGWRLGADGVNNIVEHVERYCNCEERRIALTNQASILRSKAELSLLVGEERRIAERLRNEPPPGDLRHLRRRAFYYWTVTSALTVAGFALTLLAFDPYRLGWKSYVYCIGIALVTPFLVEKVLEHWDTERFVKTLAAIACAAALVSLMILAVIRGDLLARQGTSAAPPVTMDDGSPQTPPPPDENNFYKATVPLLRFAMVLLALAMELGAGLALHKAWRSRPDQSEDWDALRNDLVQTHARMAMLVAEISQLENEPGIFVAAFWRDFYRALLTNAARNAITKLLCLLLGVMLIPHAHAQNGRPLNLVIAVDLTQSVAVTGPDEGSEFRKNIDGVTRVLAEVAPGTHVTVIGITDRSFAQPYILMSASVSPDAGYFGERLAAARGQVVAKWKSRSLTLRSDSPSTDVFGTLLLASQIFSEGPSTDRRMLVLFSDMRNSTSELNLERFQVLAQAQGASLPPGIVHADLRNVEVYALGVDGANRSAVYWQDLQQFWTGYLSGSGAIVKSFSVLRDVPGGL